MSFWDDIKNFTKPYDASNDYDDFDDDVDEGFEDETPAAASTGSRFGRRDSAAAAPAAEPAFTAASSTTTGAFSSGTTTGFTGQVVTPSNKQQLVLVRPNGFGDAPEIAANLRAKKAVVLNLEEVEPILARRVVDFLSGCTYCLDGSVKKVSSSTYVFCPHNMEVLGDLKNLQGDVEGYV